jgi:hypothetical protein
LIVADSSPHCRRRRCYMVRCRRGAAHMLRCDSIVDGKAVGNCWAVVDDELSSVCCRCQGAPHQSRCTDHQNREHRHGSNYPRRRQFDVIAPGDASRSAAGVVAAVVVGRCWALLAQLQSAPVRPRRRPTRLEQNLSNGAIFVGGRQPPSLCQRHSSPNFSPPKNVATTKPGERPG